MREISHYHRTVIGSYCLLQFIGPGPISCVYLGESENYPGQKVVVKVIEAVPLVSAAEQQRALKEVRVLAGLRHHHILPVLKVGIDRQVLYLVYPYAEAGSLRQRLADVPQGLLPMKETLALLKQIGEALHAAHQQKMVYANLKPENVLFSLNNEVMLTDFRIPTLTQSERVARTLAIFAASYMAPEQFQGLATPLSDQYALACLAYTLLTGHPPFEADDVDTLARMHASEPPRSPALLQRERTRHIDNVILKALAKQPEQRYPDVAAFLAALLAPPPLDALIETRILPRIRSGEMASIEVQNALPAAPIEQPVSSGDEQEHGRLLSLQGSSTWHSGQANAPAFTQGPPSSLTSPGASQPSRASTGKSGATSAQPSRRRGTMIAGTSLVVCLIVLAVLILPGLFVSGQSSAGQHSGRQSSITLPVSTPALQTPGTLPASPAPAATVTIHLSPGVTPGVTPTSAPSPTPIATSPTTPSSVVGSACKVSFNITSQREGDFVADLTITNSGTTSFANWSLAFTFTGNQQIIGAWNSFARQSGETVTLVNAVFNATLAPGSSTEPGFMATWSGTNAPPSSFTLNGVVCN